MTQPASVQLNLDVPVTLLRQLVQEHLATLSTPARNGHDQPAPGEEGEEEEQEEPPAPGPASTADPPLPARLYLGVLCKRGHDAGGGQSVRKRTNHSCLACERLADQRRKARLKAARARPHLVAVRKAETPAPVLPAYLAASAYLSPDVCPVWPPHRYKQSGFTLRYKDDDQCVMCVTQAALSRAEQRRA